MPLRPQPWFFCLAFHGLRLLLRFVCCLELDSADACLHLIAHLLVAQVCARRLRMTSAGVDGSSKVMLSQAAQSARGKRRTFRRYQDLVLFPTSITVELVVRAVDSSLPLCRLFSAAFLAQE